MKLCHLFLCALSQLALAAAQSTFTPARPPAIPLAVKAPYLSTWLNVGSDGGNGGYLAGEWPVFWSNQITAWTGMIRVDDTTYTWMGDPGPQAVTQTAFQYTSTKSIFTMDVAGKVEMNITFLSPITPNDLKRQSLVFSYLHVDVSSVDGKVHDVQLYSDITAEWISGDRSNIAQWDYGQAGDVAYHRVYRQTQQLFSEVDDQGEWGYWYWSTDQVHGLTYQAGPSTDARNTFAANGSLPNSQDTNYRAISDNWPVFAFAINLGPVDEWGSGVLFSIGLTQDEAVQYEGADGYDPVPSLWTSYFDSDLAAVEFFHKDYSTSSQLSTDLDNQISQDAIAAAGQDYLTIASLSVRQAFGATQLCGTPNTTYIFLKEISSDGNMNTVDVIFPAHPIFLYTNPTLLKLLLDPLYENQEAGKYPNLWAMHDLGSHYPNATGHPQGNDEEMPLEECGDMVIMTLAYALRSKDTAYLSQHYAKLEQWTSFLLDDSLYPANQISTDDFAGALANQTNLALKGMIAIKAMSVISSLTGNEADSKNYSSIAQQYINEWETLGVAHDANPPHSTLAYGSNSSYGLLYNLYADKELSLDFVPSWVYDMQSTFYPTVENKYGVPLDTRHTYTKADWQLFTAAVASKSTQQMFLNDLATWINETPTNRPLTDLYDTDTGNYPSGLTFVARPVMGGAFALLALPS
ncbi:hypothetical protein DTO164E3_1679 [Paecilomyces variotii]|nr:hypothetical protein DTO164E3_1679 [Paecilomyces variotii]KAJ9207048.1 hypothetical protein DTO032I3_1636 [Paecilomyces variotii]KAJ9226511.1 hypothetical protein DTO169C6_1239 [Paecilomyces variotii]KAJ9275769.1 hypothetical protein DTO021D3_7406 [Paecilomyces variotii]KAJ9316254.1 hypothetical protein DTO271D3_3523 [Paecilomyces variotii]